MSTTKQEKGFSIIEVVLVLAIVALIFLMIFVAWPALQRSQRDTARKNDASAVAAALGSYRGNHQGKMPTAAQFNGFKADYITQNNNVAQIDPSKITASTAQPTDATEAADTDSMLVVLGYKCDYSPNTRGAAVFVKLESTDDPSCIDA